MSTLFTRVSYCLRAPTCSSRYAVVYGKQLATWRDRLKRWHSSPKSEKEQAAATKTESFTETDTIATKDSNPDDGVDDNPLSQLVKEKDEMIAKQKTELEELNVWQM